MAFSSILARFKALFGEANSDSFDVDAEIKRAYEKSLSIDLDPSTNAAVNTTKRHVFYAHRNITVIGAKYVPDGAAAKNAANYATIALFSGSGTAAAATALATVSTTATNMVAGTPYALTISDGDVDAGETVAASILKAASGVAVPKGSLVIHYIER